MAVRIFIDRLLLTALLGAASIPALGLTSPSGRFQVESAPGGISFEARPADGAPRQLLQLHCSPVRMISESKPVEVSYDMIAGKRKNCSNSYSEGVWLLSNGDTLRVRVYNDGVAWKKKGVSNIRFGKPLHHWLQKWTDSYEDFYPQDRDVAAGMRFGYPALLEYDGGIFGLLSESGIAPGEAAASMYAREDGSFDLAPDGPENGGWQTFIAGSLSDVVESTLIADNSAPAAFEDTSWISPGVVSWVYWAYNHGSNDFDIIRRYVDLAATLKLPYVLIDAEWDEMKDGKTVEDAVAYALEKGVRPMIWYNSSVGWIDGAPGPKFRLNNPADREREFAWCSKIGVAGVKIDFFSGDTNRNIRYMSQLLEDAARHKLTVNFHGATIPRGWHRTYPNLLSVEAVYGAEWYNNLPVLTEKAVCHNATLPFTRNVIGPMDYTPCAFSDSQHPHITTHGHELALTALFESGLQHLADRPESLLAQPEEVKAYLSELPSAWDDTLLLGGYPGRYVAMARKKGSKWWISVINGTDEPIADLKLDWSRLNAAGKDIKGTMLEDAPPESSGKWSISHIVSLPESISLLPRGGMVAVVELQ